MCIFFCLYSGKRHGKGEGLIFSFNSTQSTPNYFAAEHGFYTGGWKHNMRLDLHHLLMIFFQSLVDEGLMWLARCFSYSAHLLCHFYLVVVHSQNQKKLISSSRLTVSSSSSNTYMHICEDFIQGAFTESLDSQVQGAATHPPHPWSLWPVNHFPQALL